MLFSSIEPEDISICPNHVIFVARWKISTRDLWNQAQMWKKRAPIPLGHKRGCTERNNNTFALLHSLKLPHTCSCTSHLSHNTRYTIHSMAWLTYASPTISDRRHRTAAAQRHRLCGRIHQGDTSRHVTPSTGMPP